MKRIKFIRYKGTSILYVNSSNCTADEALELFHKSHDIVKTQKRRSLLTLVDIDNVGYNLELIQTSREYLVLNKPYIKATAVLNAGYLHRFVFHSVIVFYDWNFFNSNRFGLFDDIAQAKEWLVDR